ncbi:MAG: SUMF1/EgtB/PvdO family nonheme iron enzyme [Chlamydiia bacterium]|nr:SUMF1/EgtB/PvdO family nonheme iron enzyme [Chlamydiia bacterium]
MTAQVLGDYEIIKRIGTGVLGAVFLAEHRFLKRQFALKVLPQELSEDRAFVQRFQEDVSRLAALEHPHIVKIHNVSNLDGAYFLVCDCVVDGAGEIRNLGHHLCQLGRSLSESEALRILTQIAEALDYAHTLPGTDGGLVHRCLKLSNILVSQAPGSDIDVQLSDFGLTRIIGTGRVLTRIYQNLAEGLGLADQLHEDRYVATPAAQDRLTALHQGFIQNFVFLAPEQRWPERNQEISPATDVYAFGVIAYHILTGKYPEGVFQPIAQLRSELQRDWDALVNACLQCQPAARPKLLAELLHGMGERTRASNIGTEPQRAASQYFVNVPTEEEKLEPRLESRRLERPTYDADPGAAFQVDTHVTTYCPEPAPKKDKIEPLLTDMVIIKGGAFTRGSVEGSRDEMPRHEVHLNSFAVDIHPVTNEQFVRFLMIMNGEKDRYHRDMIRLKESRINRVGGKFTVESGYHKHPVVGVTWYGASAYAKWVGKRLPTEAEWEVAASGAGAEELYPTGKEIDKTKANYFSVDTTAVMSYPPNVLGIYDLAGNVYEWCYDWYDYNYYYSSAQEPDNPKGPFQGVYRVLRGGCWKSSMEDLLCSRRHRNNPGTVNATYGFRCAADAQ